MKQPDEKLFKVLARATERRVTECNAQELANSAWAFATVKQLNEQTFTTSARAAEQRLGEFNAQQLACSA